MWTQQPVQEVDPLCLPVGLRIGPWRVVGFGGRGAYGTMYRVVREGHEAEGPRGLKLAHQPGDERFQREAWLLSRIHSPYVPQFYAQGVWEHASGAYPFLVMEWIDGEPLYDWAARRNPTQRQALGWVLHAARALVATHAVGGLHRDVKGSNVLVRRGDGRAYLTDFGAGHYRGAGTLTSKLLPPGTHAYRSPEAWAFLNAFLRHPTVHYPASTCDDLFALGVMAYRLVTDTYPPSTQPGEPGAEVWREGGSGPRRPSELNTRVRPQLDALILRLLAVAPVERFGGRAQEAVEALEQVVQGVEMGVGAPLFHSGYDHLPCWRSPEAVRLSAERDAVAREQFARRQEERQEERGGTGPDAETGRALEPRAMEERDRAGVAVEQAAPRARVRVWGAEAVVAAVGLLLAGVLGVWLHEGQGGVRTVLAEKVQDRSTDAVGDSAASAPHSMRIPGATKGSTSVAGQQLPESPLPGQRRPPCNRGNESEIRGGCWYLLGATAPPCRAEA
jgi:eukaryotic-like serine/threonine-protein kinase